jgi:hypothetical protein
MMTLQEKTIGPSPSERRAHVPSREAELMRAYGSNSLAFFGQRTRIAISWLPMEQDWSITDW